MCYAGAMPRFEPFAGVRYDAGRVDMSAVVAPPYDVVGPQDRARLAGRHSANAIRVELPEPDHRADLDRYANAARQLERWQEEGILVRDPAPSFYAYRMTTPGGRATNGVIGALGIDERSAAETLPHELTLPRPKSDRLDLLRATRANLSPIWALSLSPGLTKTFERHLPPHAAATDEDGVRHELWVIDEPSVIDAVREGVQSSPVVIADGHTATRRPSPTVGSAGQRETGTGLGPRPVPTWSWPWSSSWPRTSSRWVPSTGLCRGSPTASTWWTRSRRGST